MIKNKELFKKLKKNRFLMLMFISIITIFALTMLNIQSATAYPSFTSYCNSCHQNDMPDTWISLTVYNETPTDITYEITGSDIYDGEEGWAVFDSSNNNIDNGDNSGYFTLPKDGQTYRAFWVDNDPSKGGSAYEDITTTSTNNPPNKPTIDGPTSGKAGEPLTYTFTSTDPEGEDISYLVEWGCGESNTSDFVPSGEPVSMSHIYAEGTYIINVIAMDINQAESEPATLEVTVPRARFVPNMFLFRFSQRFPNAFPILRQLLGL